LIDSKPDTVKGKEEKEAKLAAIEKKEKEA